MTPRPNCLLTLFARTHLTCLLLFAFGMLSWLNASHELDLSGQWKFSVYPAHEQDPSWREPGYDHSKWAEITVPGSWDTENKYAHFTGTAFYVKQFEIPADWNERSFRLHFAAVYQSAEVWLNGEYLGNHVGGYTPFEFDVSELIRKNEINTLSVRVNNQYNRGAWWKWGGIHQPVTLTNETPVRIVRQKIIAEPDLEAGNARINATLRIQNIGPNAFNGQLQSRIVAWKDQQPQGRLIDTPVSIPAGEIIELDFQFQLSSDETRLWDLDSPNLYQLRSRINGSEISIAEKNDRFGIRKIETAGAKLLLNGKALHLNGFNRVATHRAFGQTEPFELIKFDIDTMMAMGARMTRIAHHAQSPELLDYCDEVGMLIIEEIPVWGKTEKQTFAHNPRTKQWLTEMIERDFNHPCIIGWSVGNELAESNLSGQKMSWRIYEYVRTMLEHVATLDTTRLKTYVSNTATDANGPGIDPNDLVDIMMHNSYGGAPDQVEKLHKIWPEKPIFVSELGKSQLGTSLDATMKDQLKEEVAALQNLDYVIGCSIWSFNDYRSHFNDTHISENRGWGMYNVWRQPKAAAYEIRELFTGQSHETSLPTMVPIPVERPENEVYIEAILAVGHSCFVGFNVVDEKDTYEIGYSRNGGPEETLSIQKLQGSAKVSDLRPGDYSFRIRSIRDEMPSEWSAAYTVTVKDL